MNLTCNYLRSFLLYTFIAFSITPATAQIIPDNTLGAEGSQLIPITANIDLIDGGALRNSNIFHSFSEFNVKDAQAAYFNNPVGVQNILTRVTGGKVSNILGTLGVLGDANLFLMNPTGIIFGQNAQLDVRGSFVGTTANGVRFGEQGIFSATNPSAPPLLTINPSALLFNQINSSTITNNSQTVNIDSLGRPLAGLQVPQDRSIVLVGGDVNFDGGFVTARGGRVDIAAIRSANADVTLDMSANDIRLNIPSSATRGDVSVDGESLINVLGSGGGEVAIHARNLTINDSYVVAGIQLGESPQNAQAGDITLDATDNIEIKGRSEIGNIILPGAIGNGGNIRINMGTLTFTDGGTLFTGVVGQGKSGNIVINARDTISLTGGKILSTVLNNLALTAGDIRITTGSLKLDNSGISTIVAQGNAGNISIDARDTVSVENGSFLASSFIPDDPTVIGQAGRIQIDTQSLFIANQSQVVSVVAGQGNAGEIDINATKRVVISGGKNNTLASISSSAVSDFGQGGDIKIATEMLSLTNFAVISAATVGFGNAGNLTIQANDISLKNGGTLTTNSFNQGNPGNIKIQADNISVDGVSDNNINSVISSLGTLGNGQAGDIDITANNLSLTNGGLLFASTLGPRNAGNITANVRDNLLIFGTSPNGRIPSAISSETSNISTGDAGNINIVNPQNIEIRDGGAIIVNSLGSGRGGDVRVQAGNLLLNRGSITAVTSSTDGGDINLQLGKTLILRNASLLSTTAGEANSGGNGGNIIINAPFIVAVPKENSDITANAFTGAGGNIRIDAQGIFGIEARSQLTNTASEITASSEFGVQGEIAIAQPDIDPTQGLIELPQDVVDASGQIGQLCPRGELAFRRPLNKFIVTGRGSLPPSPLQPLSGKIGVRPLASLDEDNSAKVSPTPNSQLPTPSIIEAQAFMKTADGGIALVANVPVSILSASMTTPACVAPS